MINNEIKYTYNDITLVPSVISEINHRRECYPYQKNGKLPIFTAPMSTVLNECNFDLYEQNNINAILPRSVDFKIRIDYAIQGKWAAFSLKEFEENFTSKRNYKESVTPIKVLIDVANGHMQFLYELVTKSKKLYKEKIVIMVGNIANPKTYYQVYKSGADYVRVGIGSGCGCITSSNTSIHMPMASLIDETYSLKVKIMKEEGVDDEKMPKIIADGGVRNYNDIIKALSLGADYVMVGSVLSKCFESSGEIIAYIPNAFEKNEMMKIHVDPVDIHLSENGKEYLYQGNKVEKLTKIFYGMASARGQKDLFGKKIKTSEGICKELEIEYTLRGWVENFTDFLRSAMSYTNAKKVEDLRNAKKVVISNNAFNAINR